MTEKKNEGKLIGIVRALEKAINECPEDLNSLSIPLARAAKNLINAVDADNPEAKPVTVKKRQLKRVKKHSSTNDRLTNFIFDCLDGKDHKELISHELIPVKTDNKGKLYVLANIRFEKLPEDLQARLADRFVRAVCDTVTSLKFSGNDVITLEMIAHAMNGYSLKRRHSSPEFLAQLEEAVEILRHTWVKIDATHEANAKGYNFEEIHFDGPLIPSYGLSIVDLNGQRVRAYEIFKEPILYSYASQKKQIISCDIQALALPTGVNMTRENIILQRYLIERIEEMRNDKNNLGRTILYETVYRILDATEATRDDKKRIRNKIKAFLDNWRDMKYIKEYHEESEGRLLRSIRIEFYPQNQTGGALNK